TSSKIGFLRRIRTFKGSNKQDGVFKMCLSPDGCLLATLHHSGQIALWDMPSMNQQKVWEQYEQPASSEDKPVYIRPIKQKHKKENPWKHNLIDVNFWSNEALILARCSGALTVSSAKTLQNLLGESCEWFEPSPHVTARYEKGFLALE
ncbi:NBAS subunit of NRZ tethering complex-like, partial [Saccoglossus kowalevskii]